MTNRKKRRFGAGGSGITDDPWDYLLRIKVGPMRLPPEEVDADTFRELLERDKLPALEPRESVPLPTAEEFMKLLSTPLARTSFQRRSAQDRYTASRKYFEQQELYWWCNQQMVILRVLDENRHQYAIGAYDTWVSQVLMPRVKKVHKALAKKDKDKAREFALYAFDFIANSKPKPRQAGSMVIIEKIRRMVIEGKVYQLQDFQSEIAPLLKPGKE